ncbi:AAA family ATPase [Flavobacterium gelatinilyticum]|uniref:AAA family ATPase n=1 Tax=Flavobacterium gelatinilyticum TaxID=3003260 RepID=UPI002480F545|nr:AAA family ATPase [Flavobacterium gelatinilyticum]
MKLNSFKAEKVHGYLNYDINFFSELTFLIGINGSGKTSALKLILGLISPSYQYLNQIEFETAELICSSREKEKDILITAKQNKKENNFSLSIKTSNTSKKTQSFSRYLKYSDNTLDIEEISIKERTYKEQFDSHEITKFIRELATPKFLGLDRKIYEGRNIDLQIKRNQLYMFQKNRRRRTSGSIGGFTAIDSSLEDVQFLIFDYFRKIAQQQPKISEEFKQKIFELSFKYDDNSKLVSEVIGIETLLDKREKVLAAITSLDLNFLDDVAKTFFEKMEKLISLNTEAENELQNDSKNHENLEKQMNLLIKWVNNSSQMKRIEEIIHFSQTYQEKIAELRSPIKRLESITSNFLKEGRKSIEIASDGEIKVKLNNDTYSNVFELSSGEKQIIIMIAHLIFEEDQKPSGVFIIDEPELSLHITWQEIFIDAITEASPKTQFILATHSPSIISKISREKFCQDLNKLNY